MKHAPNRADDVSAHGSCSLRAHSGALIPSSTPQRSRIGVKRAADRQNAPLVDAEIGLLRAVRQECLTSPKPSPAYKSP